MISIFKALDNPDESSYFQQKFIYSYEKIPEGWAGNLEDISIPDWEEEEED
ncbi:hypothetical protein [Tetragenococcus halophilus]|uniref:hypothetical protein n=1 Tax=Tetragenococcus halophilus TaxID=51669 RepID=UPI000CBC0C0E|nr:hypothetical protein [Tetragenococcus halophilus]MDN6161936.1 hypothetical protein [Atopostipes sp.]MDN6730360.1 hypothetical protein [Alkalibacterium sp.]MDN6750239.1 hypothetical protein [Staphylococcus equorum]MCO8284480.1 hypothetical protein [Tetragenococcus halophilus]GBD66038.1 hypothetical protein TEHN7116_1002 [Tetragenococcus halophilus subsp. halophilus]